ncbi:MAG: hypothetical protein GF409_01575 [Candidatus Omnitrophica bacterium]|nr:hypothetical protein [Candidatus Omnitrophota bacterium]
MTPSEAARHFIKKSARDPGYSRAELMSDCNGMALVYITTEKSKYRVNLVFDRQMNIWKVKSASAFGEDEIGEPSPEDTPCM